MRRHPGLGVMIGLMTFSGSPLFAQGIGHSFFMRGKIVCMDAGGTVACLGKADGAEVGQIFDDHYAHFQVKDGKP